MTHYEVWEPVRVPTCLSMWRWCKCWLISFVLCERLHVWTCVCVCACLLLSWRGKGAESSLYFDACSNLKRWLCSVFNISSCYEWFIIMTSSLYQMSGVYVCVCVYIRTCMYVSKLGYVCMYHMATSVYSSVNLAPPIPPYTNKSRGPTRRSIRKWTQTNLT